MLYHDTSWSEKYIHMSTFFIIATLVVIWCNLCEYYTDSLLEY